MITADKFRHLGQTLLMLTVDSYKHRSGFMNGYWERGSIIKFFIFLIALNTFMHVNASKNFIIIGNASKDLSDTEAVIRRHPEAKIIALDGIALFLLIRGLFPHLFWVTFIQ